MVCKIVWRRDRTIEQKGKEESSVSQERKNESKTREERKNGLTVGWEKRKEQRGKISGEKDQVREQGGKEQ